MDTLYTDPSGDAILLFEGLEQAPDEETLVSALISILSESEESMECSDMGFGEVWGATKIFIIEMFCSLGGQPSESILDDWLVDFRLSKKIDISDELKAKMCTHIDEFRSKHDLSSTAADYMKTRVNAL